MTVNPKARALLATAAAGQAVADGGYGIVCDLGRAGTPRERIRRWREVRLAALRGLDRQVLLELLCGATWEEVADGYGLTVAEMRARFEPTLEVWSRAEPVAPRSPGTGEFTVGQPYDGDPQGTALGLDTWVERHAEPWQECGPAQVTEAMAVLDPSIRG